MIQVFNVEQRSPEWFALHAGVPTASNFDKIVTTKGEPSKQRNDYLYKLAGEFVSGHVSETYQSPAMERGVELEAEARSLFEVISGATVNQVGFIKNELAGCSPDGLVNYGGIEIKCPLIHTHVEYLLGGKLPTKYFQQVQGSLFITELEYWHFMSYYPGIKPLVVSVEPDVKFIEKLKSELVAFNQELQEVIKAIS